MYLKIVILFRLLRLLRQYRRDFPIIMLSW